MGDRIMSALRERGSALGTWVQMGSPETCQIAGLAGYDFVIIDMEHGALDIGSTAGLIRGAAAGGIDAVVRPPDRSPTEVRRALDAGARGVLVPGIRSEADARAAVESARYEPGGRRGACPCVPSAAFGTVPWQEHRAHADEPLVWLLIETPEAIEKIEAILAAGPDAIALGPFDLSLAMGLDGRFDHPRVQEALDRATKAARAAGVEVVYVALDLEPERNAVGVQQAFERGCRIATTFIDRTLLAHCYTETVRAVRERIGSGS
jgi:2-keto-3-deoxy-L-rhamnonate aldolase RhmA